jgi:predicted dehydrogenase
MRVVQVGVGSRSFGRLWRQGMADHREIEVVGLVDVNGESLDEARRHFGLPAAACAQQADRAFLKQCRAELIIDSTPHAFHYQTALTAFRCGVDVIVVKPMSDAYETARTMVAEATRLGRKLVVAQQLRFHPAVLEVRKLIGEGAVGAVAYACVDSIFPRTGPVREKWYQPHPLLLECAIHHFDMMRWMLGIEPVRVTAEEWNMPWNEEVWGKKSAVAMFETADNARIMYRGLSIDQPGEGYPGSWTVEGTEGRLALERGIVSLGGKRVWPPGAETVEAPLDLAALNSRMLDDALPYFAGTGGSMLTGEDNLRSLRMAFAAIEASAAGRRVELSP